jgi:hypothetical protein
MKINHRRAAKKVAKQVDGMVAHTMHTAPTQGANRAKYEQKTANSKGSK